MKQGFDPRRQGDIGEAEAIRWLTGSGARVFVPLFHSPDYDFAVDFGAGLRRVQVKTSGYVANGRFVVQLATNGGNQSWSGTVKHFDRARYDLLFVLVADGRRWLIPSAAIDARRSICLGGPKYSQDELPEDGDEIFASAQRPLGCPSPRGSADVGESGEPVKFVPRAEWVRIPPPPFSSPTWAVGEGVRTSHIGRTRISPGRQTTIPIGPFGAAGLLVGDQLEVIAEGPEKSGSLVCMRLKLRCQPKQTSLVSPR